LALLISPEDQLFSIYRVFLPGMAFIFAVFQALNSLWEKSAMLSNLRVVGCPVWRHISAAIYITLTAHQSPRSIVTACASGWFWWSLELFTWEWFSTRNRDSLTPPIMYSVSA